jgi:2-octaprenyl-6-methoxyphenol hydroxylase
VADFNTALNDRGCDVLGQLTLITERKAWPIISQIADRLEGPRLALIAEAGHVIPPIGAQGLNMSLSDLQCLSDLINNADDIGSADLLTKYHRARWLDIKARVTGVDLLNRAAMTNSESLKALRLKGLQTLYGIEPLRKSIMRLGLGAV